MPSLQSGTFMIIAEVLLGITYRIYDNMKLILIFQHILLKITLVVMIGRDPH